MSIEETIEKTVMVKMMFDEVKKRLAETGEISDETLAKIMVNETESVGLEDRMHQAVGTHEMRKSTLVTAETMARLLGTAVTSIALKEENVRYVMERLMIEVVTARAAVAELMGVHPMKCLAYAGEVLTSQAHIKKPEDVQNEIGRWKKATKKLVEDIGTIDLERGLNLASGADCDCIACTVQKAKEKAEEQKRRQKYESN